MPDTKGTVDLLVVGGGTAGIVGAVTAARLGASVVLVERARTGGDCLWTGCVPSKTLIAAARARGSTSPAPFEQVRARIRGAVTAVEPHDSPETLRAAGVDVVAGDARLLAPGTAEVDGARIRFRSALIATGAAPALPPIPGLESARVVTSETVWDLEELPERLVVIGGGPVACELGQALARLGSRVTVLARSRLLSKEDPDAAALVRKSMTRDGVKVIEGATVTEISTAGHAGVVHVAGHEDVPADVVLVATGRAPRTAGLGLEQVGVACDEHGRILVDDALRTTAPGVWAAGDVTTNPEHTHLAGVHASVAASNAVLGLSRRAGGVVPRVTFTDPEVAAVGVTTAEGPGTALRTVDHAELDRAITEGRTEGFTRLVLDRRGRILGGTIVSPRAGESVGELTLAVQQRLTTRALAGVTHPYPTYNDGLWNAAVEHAQGALGTVPLSAAFGVLRRAARWRADRRGR